jgi:hypothetical protein
MSDRARYIVEELKSVQDAHGDGYLSALDGGRKCFEALARGEIKTRSFDLNGEWSPWYTLHKTFAGLRDAYRFTGDTTALALETKFAGWAERTLSGLSDEQLQRMMETEFGGMNEGAGRPLRRHRRPALVDAVLSPSNTACSSNRWRGIRTTSPACTRTRRFPSSSVPRRASPRRGNRKTSWPRASSSTAWRSTTASRPAGTAPTSTSGRPITSATAWTGGRRSRATSTTC